TDYFLGNRNLPWGAVMLSVVATETSTLTFLSIPGVAYMGTFGFLQLTFGYLAGRVAVSAILLPAYYRGELSTAYELLQTRYGIGTRRFTSAIFMVTRLLADSVRLFATAIPLALITGWPYPVSIAVIGVLTLVYTYIGGIKAVVWVDALQMGLYMVGAVVAMAMLQALVPGGWGEILSSGSAAGKLAVLDFSFDLAVPYTFWAGLVGGAFLTMGSHGTDQLLVQRLLTCRNLKASQRALVGSAFGVMVQFVLFLAVGLGLWVFYQGRAFERSDEIFALFIVQQLPPGVAGLLVAGVFAAAMSSLSSSINSLASASAYDFWAPARGAEEDEARILRAGKIFTLIWAVLLVGGAVLFIPLSRGTAAVEVALGIASAVYGGLIGAFALGIFSPRSDQRSVSLGIVAGIGVVMVIWLTMPERVAWPWFAVIGTAVTYLVGAVAGRGRSLR
ncbi:MAG: sodium:solute symporter, partial [Gemmatimonadetes bacterium]|nr:sodium:solute symporter [Gemmatimonadota bacterium]